MTMTPAEAERLNDEKRRMILRTWFLASAPPPLPDYERTESDG